MTRKTRKYLGISAVVLMTASLFIANHYVLADLTVVNGMSASNVLGQPDMNSPATPTGSGLTIQDFFPEWYSPIPATSSSLHPNDIAIDSLNDLLFVSDSLHHRVAIYDLSAGISDGMSFMAVLGQPDMVTRTENTTCGGGSSGATNPCGLNSPRGIVYDSVNMRLFVGDTFNHRVVVFDGSDGWTNGEPAIAVLGQQDFFSGDKDTDCNGTPFMPSNPCGMRDSFTVEYDAAHSLLYVGDDNDRVVIFDLSGGIVNGMPASKVLGQPDMYTHEQHTPCGDTNPVGPRIPDACNMYSPSDIEWDPIEGLLYISAYWSNRVMVWELGTTGNPLDAITNGMPADFVIGQPDFSSIANTAGGGVYFNHPDSITIDHAGNRLFISDTNACRVVVYDITGGARTATEFGATPSGVIGWPNLNAGGWQPDYHWLCGRVIYDPATQTYSNYTQWATPDKLTSPLDVIWDDKHQRLFVVDGSAKRVLVYGTAVDGVPVTVTGNTSATSTPNPDGTTTLDIVSASGGNTYSITLPPGTAPAAGQSNISITVENPSTTFNLPRVLVDAQLPPGTTKTVQIEVGDANRVCLKDKSNAIFGADVKKLKLCKADGGNLAKLPKPGKCKNVKVNGDLGDDPKKPTDPKGRHKVQLCRSADGQTLTVKNALHTAIEMFADAADDDDFDDDGHVDSVDSDADNDGHPNDEENCKYGDNEEQIDDDGDGIGNMCDDD